MNSGEGDSESGKPMESGDAKSESGVNSGEEEIKSGEPMESGDRDRNNQAPQSIDAAGSKVEDRKSVV